MAVKFLLLTLLAGCVVVQSMHNNNNCSRVKTMNRSLRDIHCDQPIFVNIVPKIEETIMLDNICITMFPLPDDPSTFQVYVSRVYCDGSFEVSSLIATEISQGVHRGANPFRTRTSSVFGYAGCDTYLAHLCTNYGPPLEGVFGGSSKCAPIGLSCLKKIEELVREQGLPDQDFYVLPMKLPNRCVTQQQCIAKPNNLFHKALGLPGPVLGLEF